MKIAIIGAGNMGSAIARGLAKGNLVQPDPTPRRANSMPCRRKSRD